MTVQVAQKPRIPGSTKQVCEAVVKIDFVQEILSMLDDAQIMAEETLDAPVQLTGYSKDPGCINIYFRRTEDIFDSRPNPKPCE